MAKPQAPKLVRPKLNLNFGPKGDEPDIEGEVDVRAQRKEVASLMNEVSGAPREVKSVDVATPEDKTRAQRLQTTGATLQEGRAGASDALSQPETPSALIPQEQGEQVPAPSKPLQRRRARKKLKREHNFSCRSTFEHIDFLDALTNDSGTVVEGFERAVWLLAKEVARKKEYRGLPVSDETLEVVERLLLKSDNK
ncbi:hypothetical protein [Woodsholea maritima]|uniref:hypothetical protein n=1 Tax=Woodsholea maritima TaxID=240237 RepID=UPI00037E8243|nr:hypothetical protein [Woodsholea maritima]